MTIHYKIDGKVGKTCENKLTAISKFTTALNHPNNCSINNCFSWRRNFGTNKNKCTLHTHEIVSEVNACTVATATSLGRRI